MTLRNGYLLLPEMNVLREQWSSFIDTLKLPIEIEWAALRDIAREWAFPERMGIAVQDDIREFMRSFAYQILVDIGAFAQGHTGLLHWINQFSIDSNLDLRYDVDRDFEILYPVAPKVEWRDLRRKIESMFTH